MKQSLAGRLFRALAARRGCIIAPLAQAWQREREIIADTRRETQLLLTDAAALHLMVSARAAAKIPGAFAEAGVFQGGSARLICEEKGESELHLFDVFETLQCGASEGGEVQDHFGLVHGKCAEVQRLLAPYKKVHFHIGLFPRTTRGLEELKFAFVHLDLDLAGPTRAALEFFHPRLMLGGILIGDDFNDPDVRACFDDWFSKHRDTVIELPWSQVMVVRQAAR